MHLFLKVVIRSSTKPHNAMTWGQGGTSQLWGVDLFEFGYFLKIYYYSSTLCYQTLGIKKGIHCNTLSRPKAFQCSILVFLKLHGLRLWNNRILLWYCTQGRLKHAIISHSAPASAVAIDPSCTQNSTKMIWNWRLVYNSISFILGWIHTKQHKLIRISYGDPPQLCLLPSCHMFSSYLQILHVSRVVQKQSGIFGDMLDFCESKGVPGLKCR